MRDPFRHHLIKRKARLLKPKTTSLRLQRSEVEIAVWYIVLHVRLRAQSLCGLCRRRLEQEFEKLAGEMKDIRSMADHAARKERACALPACWPLRSYRAFSGVFHVARQEVALRLGSTLGIDSDSD